MKEFKPLMALCPMGKFVFSNEDAVHYKKQIQKKLTQWGVRYIDLEGVLKDGLVKDQSHVDTAVEHFQKAGADCLFLPHCNFGTEGAVGMIAKKLGIPTLLWGPRDEAPLPDGTRLRDSLCGLLASSKVLHKLGVPFTYIENCRIDDAPFRKGVDTFVRAVSIADTFRKGIRIGFIGHRVDFFWTTIINESELLERFKVEILPLDLARFIEAVKDRAVKGRKGYEKEVKKIRRNCLIEDLEDSHIVSILAVRDQLLRLGEEHGLEGFAFLSFTALLDAIEAYSMYAEMEVSEQYAMGHECDIHGLLSDVLLRRANFNQSPAFLTEFTIRHPENDNGVLLWHGAAPPTMCHPESSIRIGHHWILPSPVSGMVHFKLKDGPITVARFDGDGGDYQLAVGEGKTIPGPDTLNNYLWMEVDDWPRWERISIEGPFIHHVGMAYGHYSEALVEACKYIPGLRPIRLNKS